MLKGAAEAVWPPYLEEALLKGMQNLIGFRSTNAESGC
jgi:hypothetical protein